MDSAPRAKGNGMGTWMRYKLGQAQFQSWLKQTAEKLTRKDEKDPEAPTGDVANNASAAGDECVREPLTCPSDVPQQQQQPRRHKKKKGKEKVDIRLESTPPDSDKSVHWSQLEDLAQRVADNATPDDVPDSAINVLRDVVNLRKKSFSFFSRATKDTKDEKVKQSNANHAHIIGVLEHVLAKLESVVKPARAGAGLQEPKEGAAVPISDLHNLFAHLEVQSPPNATEDVPSAPEEKEVRPAATSRQKMGKRKAIKKAFKNKHDRRSEPSTTKQQPRAPWVDDFRFGLPGEGSDDEEDEDPFDLYMMVYCFFVDFNTIRNYVAERWCDYWFDRSVPLPTLAAITSAAFDLFEEMEFALTRDLMPIDPALARFDFMVGMLFFQYGIDHIDYDSYASLTKAEVNERIWRDESDWVALMSYFTLQDVVQRIPLGKTPVLAPLSREPVFYGAKNLDEWRKFESTVTRDIIMEAAHLKALKHNDQVPPKLPAEHGLLLGLQEYLRWKDYWSALVFSLHLWVDIRNIMEMDVEDAFNEMHKSGKKLLHALKTHNPTKYHARDHDFKRGWLARMWETNELTVDDFMYDDKKARFRQVGVTEDPVRFFLLRNEPVWAGMLDLRVRLVHSWIGHESIKLSSIVDTAAYLYHAAAATEHDLPPWDVLEQYIATFLDDSPFRVGLRGERPADIIRNLGSRVGEYNERWGRMVRPDITEKYIPDITIRDTLAQLSELRGGEEGEQKSNGHASTESGSHAVAETSTGAAKGQEQVGEDDGQQRQADRALSQQLSPVDMLQLLDKTITEQVTGILTLDYFKLFDQSVALLKAVVKAFGPKMEKRLEPRDESSAAYLDKLGFLIVRDLASNEEKVVGDVVAACREFVKTLAIESDYVARGTDTKDKLLGPIYEGAAGRTRLDPSSPPFTPHSVTWIASMTKLITAVSVMHFLEKQQQEKLPNNDSGSTEPLTLDTDTAHYLPELAAQPILTGFTSEDSDKGQPILVPNPSPITLRHLLTHTSGLGLDIADPLLLRWSKHVGRQSTLLNCTIDGWSVPLRFKPGEGWYYGVSLDWAGVLLQRAAGCKLGEYLRRELAGLGLERTDFVLSRVLESGEGDEEYVPVSERVEDGGLKEGKVLFPMEPEWESGGAGAYSCAEDVGKVLSGILGALAGGEAARMGKEAATEMFRPQLDERQRAWLRGNVWMYGSAAEVPEGMAVDHGMCGLLAMDDVPGKRRKGSTWWSGMCNSRWWLDPETGIGAVLLVNVTPYGDATVLRLFDELERAVYAELVPAS
ncbi:hypothetical protein VTJ49DRAFT_3606 [Mycothermus thermophilus]|uniref:Beta-lactamase-related domain-containing protein n=1 Tax=Humicola insolens TaxID=85995 RepID=A0ABR3VNF8_HUMIN